MEFKITPLLAYITSWLGFMGGLWALFDRAETVASQNSKAAISKWLRSIDIAPNENWPSTFAVIFDRVFGKRHLSVRCFFFSSITSISSVLVLTLIWTALRPVSAKKFFESGWEAALFLGFLAAIFNLIPDYVSLLETRYLIRWMENVRSGIAVAGLLAVDFLITTVVILIVFCGVMAFIGGSFEEIRDYVVYGFMLNAPPGDDLSVGIFFYSTYFTSLWLWLYAGSGVTIRLFLAPADRILRMLKSFLDLEEKPLRSLGFVSMMLVSVVYLVVPFFV